MNKEFQTLRKKQRFGLRKLNIGVASVLLGFTIFGYNLTSQAPVAHAATVATSAGSGASGGVTSGSQASNSQAAGQATPATQVTVPAASQSSAPANSGNATSSPASQVTVPAASQSSAPANSGNATSSPASQAGSVSANHTAIGTTPSSQTVSVNETTSSATQAQTLMMNLAVVNPDTDTLPKSTQTYTLVRQPLLTDYLTHLHDGKRDGNTWVDKTVGWYPNGTLDTIFGTTSKSKPGIIASHPDKYFFGAYVDYNSSYHRVILLARSQDPNDHNLYSYTIHTGRQITSSTTAAPDTDTQEVYAGASGSKYDLIFKNYQGKSYTVILKNFEDGDWGLLPVFDGGLLDPTYGSNTYDQNNKAAETKSIGFWAGAIPQETSTKVRYVDQATGKDIVQPMEISGFGYQGFQVKGEAPTVKGYHVVSKPKSLGLAYEDGTIAPYKVGQTYDLALPDSVVIKQTVIDTDGTVRATAYYKGSLLSKNASRILGRERDNDQMSFVTPDSKFHTYTNRIGQVDDSYIYYYAKDSDPNGSEMRLHFIDVTGVNNSNYAPSDGPELDVDKVQTIHGNIGENYSFTYTVPKGYDQVAVSDVTGTYSGTHHDAYVYVKKQAENSDADLINAQAGKTPDVPRGVEIKKGDEAPAGIVVAKDKDDKDTTFPEGTKVTWETAPDVTKNGPATGKVTVTYPDKTTDTVDVTVNVVPSDADKNDV
ncbi:Rib/alpha-like domain-containing protein, partial [Limosilactobacillus mucosae]|uniref:Rib/alpha-like domain-containing protein n=1 Tax=Limosilactobacillus mucosae TaxID=97478 RepID=UPI0025A431B5